MKNRIPILLAIALLGGLMTAAILPQEKPKDLAIAPKMIEVPFSPSDAVEINKQVAISKEAGEKIAAILNSYGDHGDVIVNAKGIWVGVMKPEPKVEKKP